ncbi:MAG: secondary thiamine-phosphate synthase enzyme YjbQ [Kiritimatiellales bacterium]|nr:secondary thiamine-phosphate synthase enzyme YjbQ [Kiritimatiellales bacterium]
MNEITVQSKSRTAFIDITSVVQQFAAEKKMHEGLITVFVPHTTAGVTINENADPDVTADMETILDRMIPWNGGYRHGEGNTAAHVKASLMGSSVQVIVENCKLRLGTWQSIYFCEFDGPRIRNVWLKESA